MTIRTTENLISINLTQKIDPRALISSSKRVKNSIKMMKNQIISIITVQDMKKTADAVTATTVTKQTGTDPLPNPPETTTSIQSTAKSTDTVIPLEIAEIAETVDIKIHTPHQHITKVTIGIDLTNGML